MRGRHEEEDSMRQGLLATAAIVALVGCAQVPAGPGATLGTAPPDFRCPPAGTNIVTSDGRNITYGGAAAGDPFTCTGTTSAGGGQSWLANFYPVPTEDEATLRRNLAALWPLGPGKAISFTRQIGSPNGALAFVTTGWHVLGQRALPVAGTERQVLVIENSENMPRIGGYSGVWTLFYDLQARAFVGGDLQVLRGSNTAQNWRATGVTVPGGS
jgi:hypothetical protein